MPRPLDFLVKFPYYWFGFFLALFTVGISEKRLAVINLLFGKNSSWNTVYETPGWTVVLLGVILFVISEIFLQQGKLIWNDLRDKEKDQKYPNYRVRAIARGLLSAREAQINLFIRWTLALVLGLILGGTPLLFVFGLILLHQAIYEFWAKAQGQKHPLVPMFTVAFNFSLRFLTGVVVVVGSDWNHSIFILMFIGFYFASLGFISTMWKMEAAYVIERKLPQYIRPQNQYFHVHGARWQHIGLLSTSLTIFGVMILEFFSHTHTSPLISGFFGSFSPASGKFIYVEYPYIKATLIMIALIIGGVLMARLLISTLRWILVPAKKLILKMQIPLGIILSLIFVIVFMHALIQQSSFLLLTSMFLLNTVLFVSFEEMKYPEIDFKQYLRAIDTFNRKTYRDLFSNGNG